MRASSRTRPAVYDYSSPVDFLSDLVEHYRSRGSFSLRQRTARAGTCSQALVSQILNGKRQLNRDNWMRIAPVFNLTKAEQEFIDGKLSLRRQKEIFPEEKTARVRTPKNQLLNHWLHPYVKDLVSLNGFSLEPENLFSMLKGIAPPESIRRSVEFLLREGFWRRLPSGKIVAEEAAAVTTHEIPNEKIRAFHRKALEVASRGISTFSIDRRKASTVLISVDRDKIPELRSLMDSFYNQLLEFVERNPEGRDSLVQVTMHLTPIGERPCAEK